MKQLKKEIKLSASLVLAATMLLAGCSSGGSSTAPNQTPGSDTAAPAKQTKLRVMIYDRGNAPASMKLDDSPLIQWTKDEVKKLGIDLEFATVPRGEAEDKLNVWLASGQAPDIIFTYGQDTLFRYADQGGIWELDDLLKKNGQQLLAHNKAAFDQVGKYKGKTYSVPMLRGNPHVGPIFKIRQDWLDKLGMKAPTTVDELYTVLKAFKEQDPGGVGKDKVVPWAFPAIGKAFLYNIGLSYGIMNDGTNNGTDMLGGNLVDGQFVSNVALPQAKEMFLFLNKLYKEGLLPKEFATDVNAQQYNQYIATGTAGFVDSNDTSTTLTDKTMKAVPNARWVVLDPLKRKDGTQAMMSNPSYGMFIMIPKSSKQEQAEAAIKYLNWMANDKVIANVQSGLEGVHWKLQDGLRIPIDPEKYSREVSWFAQDLAIVQQGQPPAKKEELRKKAESAKYFDPEYSATENFRITELFQKYGKAEPMLSMPRPFSQKNKDTIAKLLNDSFSKIIISNDPAKEYDAMLAAWEKIGGREYDKEMTQALQQLKQ
ncbi:putative aldouronate transport system substrate-binding protein [Paenibacillus sp. UNCCL117]|uniref:extracellular solute-binding protein n=1 Tax=unclassified Paenibacillus TaxID=185978 RepID=UPI000888AB78|nr:MULTISPECIES: extracellular solute-binding protein [unclassified Paenibacillus]SDC52315.1 putative aldouronate transport system substrate-binding protein [Paenibacillus sp. cl123]SFW11331.1 putative aldouronate transport system substrate-binding protein [Paenibacillus sp. UNCCL117]